MKVGQDAWYYILEIQGKAGRKELPYNIHEVWEVTVLQMRC